MIPHNYRTFARFFKLFSNILRVILNKPLDNSNKVCSFACEIQTLTLLTMARLTKYDIAKKIENLPGNTPWGTNSMMTIICGSFTRAELVEKYNNLVDQRSLALERIS